MGGSESRAPFFTSACLFKAAAAIFFGADTEGRGTENGIDRGSSITVLLSVFWTKLLLRAGLEVSLDYTMKIPIYIFYVVCKYIHKYIYVHTYMQADIHT